MNNTQYDLSKCHPDNGLMPSKQRRYQLGMARNGNEENVELGMLKDKSGFKVMVY